MRSAAYRFKGGLRRMWPRSWPDMPQTERQAVVLEPARFQVVAPGFVAGLCGSVFRFQAQAFQRLMKFSFANYFFIEIIDESLNSVLGWQVDKLLPNVR